MWVCTYCRGSSGHPAAGLAGRPMRGTGSAALFRRCVCAKLRKLSPVPLPASSSSSSSSSASPLCVSVPPTRLSMSPLSAPEETPQVFRWIPLTIFFFQMRVLIHRHGKVASSTVRCFSRMNYHRPRFLFDSHLRFSSSPCGLYFSSPSLLRVCLRSGARCSVLSGRTQSAARLGCSCLGRGSIWVWAGVCQWCSPTVTTHGRSHQETGVLGQRMCCWAPPHHTELVVENRRRFIIYEKIPNQILKWWQSEPLKFTFLSF